jgi:DNA-binding response OmpR family regulator
MEGELRMARILLVEDNPHITKFNSVELTARGNAVMCAETLEKAREIMMFHTLDLIVLDIMMPDGNGTDFCRECREKGYHVPVLFLTALDDGSDIVEGLKAGGDDYLTKPYDIDEFIARIDALIRRCSAAGTDIDFGRLKLDTVSLRGYLDGQDMSLTQKEYSVLAALIRQGGQAVPRERMYKMIWGEQPMTDMQVLRTTVSRLKRKLDTDRTGIDIVYEREQGYRLE